MLCCSVHIYTITSCTVLPARGRGRSGVPPSTRAAAWQELLCCPPQGCPGPPLSSSSSLLGLCEHSERVSPLFSPPSIIISRCARLGRGAEWPRTLPPSVLPSSQRRERAQMLAGPSRVHLFHMTQRQLLLAALLPPPPCSPSSSSSSLPGSSLATRRRPRRSRGPGRRGKGKRRREKKEGYSIPARSMGPP